MTVYLDLVMLLNFLVDLCLLTGTNRLSGYPPGLKRCVLGAAFGGLYSGMCLLPGFRFLGNILWRMVSLLIMSGIAFGSRRQLMRQAGIFMLLSMALGGLAVSFGKGQPLQLLLCGMVLWCLCRGCFPDTSSASRYEEISIRYGEKETKLLALRDTGNNLTDPVTGEPVVVISAGAAKELTGLTDSQLRSPLDTVAQRMIPGLRLIPCRTIIGGGMLLAMRFPEVRIGKKSRSAVVAFAPDSLGRGEGYQALTGGVQ